MKVYLPKRFLCDAYHDLRIFKFTNRCRRLCNCLLNLHGNFYSDEVYGESEEGSIPKVEYSLLNPTNPYAASKACCEMILNAYWVKFSFIYEFFISKSLRRVTFQRKLENH